MKVLEQKIEADSVAPVKNNITMTAVEGTPHMAVFFVSENGGFGNSAGKK